MEKPFMVVYVWENSGNWILLSSFKTLAEASENRRVSGDLVYDARTMEIVKDQTWLFDWEKKDSECYVKRMLETPVKLGSLLYVN